MAIYKPNSTIDNFNEDSVLTEQLDTSLSAERSNSWWESFRAASEATEKTTRQGQDDLANQVLTDYISEISKAVGKDVTSEFDKLSEGYDNTTDLFGGTVSVWRTPFTEGKNGKLENRLTNFEQVVRKIKEENPEANFNFKSLSQLREDWESKSESEMAAADQKLAKSNSEGQLGFDDAGRLLGGIWGIMKDPRNLAAMVAPLPNIKVGAQFASSLVKAAGLGAAYQTAVEADRLSFAPGDPVEQLKASALNITLAGAGTALLGASTAVVQSMFKLGLNKTASLADEIANLAGSADDVVAGKALSFELNQAAAAVGDENLTGAALRQRLDTIAKSTASAEDALISGKPLDIAAADDSVDDLVKQYRAAEGTYYGRHKYTESQLQRMRDEFGAGTPKAQNEADLLAMSTDQAAWKAARSAEDQQIAEAIRGIRELDGSYNSTVENASRPDFFTSLKEQRASPDFDLGARMSTVSAGKLASDPGSYEGMLRTAASTTGDDLKGFTFTADVLGTSRKTEMGAARFMQNVDKARNTLKELKNCILGIAAGGIE
jgi:hypothetical protein